MSRVVSEHHCSRNHPDGADFARCVWPGTAVSGNGTQALLITCPDARVVLVEHLTWAHVLHAELNVFGCGPMCAGEHELVAIDHDWPAKEQAQ